MQVKKISGETTFLKKTELHKVQIGDKVIRIYEHTTQDSFFSDYEYDTDIDERDLELLTEEEQEELSDYMTEILDMKDGEEWDTTADNTDEENAKIKEQINRAKK